MGAVFGASGSDVKDGDEKYVGCGFTVDEFIARESGDGSAAESGGKDNRRVFGSSGDDEGAVGGGCGEFVTSKGGECVADGIAWMLCLAIGWRRTTLFVLLNSSSFARLALIVSHLL